MNIWADIFPFNVNASQKTRRMIDGCLCAALSSVEQNANISAFWLSYSSQSSLIRYPDSNNCITMLGMEYFITR